MVTQDPESLLNRLVLESGENSWLEFKLNNDDPEYIGRWISACGNAAILAQKPRAYLVFGVENGTRKKIGTRVKLNALKKGGEGFVNWATRMVTPHLMMEFLDFESEGNNFSIIVIEPTYDRPIQFSGEEYMRLGENIKKLKDYPNHERALWIATGRKTFESAIALSHQTASQVFEKLDVDVYYRLVGLNQPPNETEILRKLEACEFITDNFEGGYDITNLGAILLARDLRVFPSVSKKSVRVITYVGNDKSQSRNEIEGRKGYAVGFAGLLDYVLSEVPSEEQYVGGIRKRIPIYPEIALREIIANSLIHQDFIVSGAAPVIEVYSDRVEITNPGNSLIEIDRIIDERRSRNETLASTARSLGLCEERGGGLDKALIEIEARGLPAFDFEASENSMRVVLFGPKKFNKLSKEEKHRACFYHCVLRWVARDYMSNATLRERFSLPPQEYQAVSVVISEVIKKNRIIPAEEGQGNRYAKYVPYWVR